MVEILTLIGICTTIIINLYTLYTIRLQLGHLGNEALKKAKEVVNDIKK